VVNALRARGEKVRALVLPGDKNAEYLSGLCELCFGDVCDISSLRDFFKNPGGTELICIHAAGIVSISSKFNRKVYEVNVNGTKNILAMCFKNKVSKLVYVSSVHAIAEAPPGKIIRETKDFSPDTVFGLYAKTKSKATRAVLSASKKGLDACVVHPSGILGPGDYGRGHSTQLVIDYFKGRLTACVDGGYDFVDVRDVADGIVNCCDRGRPGECYILSNEYCRVVDMLEILHEITGRKKVRTVLPFWFASLTAPIAELYYKLLRRPPLYTPYSMYTIMSNAHFSHEKAARELSFHPRSIRESLRDTVFWLKKLNRI